MKNRNILFTSAGLIGVVGTILAQRITNWSHVNAVDEEQAREVASQLVIGMPQKDAIRLLATNGLHATSGNRDTHSWSIVYCFTNNRHDLTLEFRQKPG